MTNETDRLDRAMVGRGLVPTRSRAHDLISRGLVKVNGQPGLKPAMKVSQTTEIVVEGPANYVSRGALKLAAALDAFGLDPADCVCLDVGASTGGFTEVLLSYGAAKIYAVDVGHNQLHPNLSSNPKVQSMEGIDARALTRDLVPDPIDVIVADVSFISLEKVLPAAMALTRNGAWLAALIKPQFEAGIDGVGKGGIVRDEKTRQAQIDKISSWISSQKDWRTLGVVPSPIEGGSGNQEYLIGAKRNDE